MTGFPAIQLEHALPNYAELEQTFPWQGFVPMNEVGSKNTLNEKNPAFEAFMKTNPQWRGLYEEARSETHIRSVLKSLDIAEAKVTGLKFEFSQMTAAGGHILAHPDTPKKIATVVWYFPGEWNDGWGGGFRGFRHKTAPNADFSYKQPAWEELESIFHAPFGPNRCVRMRRTPTSLHGVMPMTGPRNVMRNTVTFNIIGQPL